MIDDEFPTGAVLAGAFAGLIIVAAVWDDSGSSSTLTAPATSTSTVTAPITNTNTITITNPYPASAAQPAPAASGIVGTPAVALVLGVVLAVGLVAVLGGMAAAFLFGSQGGMRGIGSGNGEYSYRPSLTREPAGRRGR